MCLERHTFVFELHNISTQRRLGSRVSRYYKCHVSISKGGNWIEKGNHPSDKVLSLSRLILVGRGIKLKHCAVFKVYFYVWNKLFYRLEVIFLGKTQSIVSASYFWFCHNYGLAKEFYSLSPCFLFFGIGNLLCALQFWDLVFSSFPSFQPRSPLLYLCAVPPSHYLRLWNHSSWIIYIGNIDLSMKYLDFFTLL